MKWSRKKNEEKRCVPIESMLDIDEVSVVTRKKGTEVKMGARKRGKKWEC